MAVDLVSETFADRVGEGFTAAPSLGGDPLELVLSSCDLAEHPALDRVPFSLVFHATGGEHLPQQIFTLTHAELGELALFLVPLGPDTAGMAYEAVIS
jgi:hypothetical protein